MPDRDVRIDRRSLSKPSNNEFNDNDFDNNNASKKNKNKKVPDFHGAIITPAEDDLGRCRLRKANRIDVVFMSSNRVQDRP